MNQTAKTSPQDLSDLYIRSALIETPDVFHGFFKRTQGHSQGLYAGLNCGAGSNDDPQSVAQNRAVVANTAGCAPENLLSVHQIHSPTCIYIEKNWGVNPRPQADAMVTDKPGLALGVLTADCAPVLFYGQTKDGAPVIGAAHSGWGGALKGVLEATLETMQARGTLLESIKACVGPCIAQASYEVGENFAAAFLDEDEANEHFFIPARREGHLMFDLPGYCAAKLAKNGIKNVQLIDCDTYAEENDFFSYRRATHRGESDYGRQISAIMIRK